MRMTPRSLSQENLNQDDDSGVQTSISASPSSPSVAEPDFHLASESENTAVHGMTVHSLRMANTMDYASSSKLPAGICSVDREIYLSCPRLVKPKSIVANSSEHEAHRARRGR